MWGSNSASPLPSVSRIERYSIVGRSRVLPSTPRPSRRERSGGNQARQATSSEEAHDSPGQADDPPRGQHEAGGDAEGARGNARSEHESSPGRAGGDLDSGPHPRRGRADSV